MVLPLDKDESYDALSINDFHTHKRAFLKIQDGCNNFCTYCIIPYTRGRIRSKTKEVILKEVKQLVSHGHIEVVLTGIHTGGYGEDLKDYSFLQLLKDLENIEGLERIRISSIEITELDADIIETIKNSKKIVHHLHVPLQGGTDKILKRMNRKYTKSEYEAMIMKIKSQIPGVALTTDVIVGFPGETDSDFEESYDFIKSLGFQELHVFPFSKRKGTPADKMIDQVDGRVKKERVHKLLQLSETLLKQYVENSLDKEKLVIAEQIKDDYLVGHSRDYIAIRFKGDQNLIGKEVIVRLTGINKPYNDGELIKNPQAN